MKNIFLLLGLSTLFFSSCRDQEILQHEQDISTIQKHLAQKNIPAIEEPNSNLFYYFTKKSNLNIYPVRHSKLEIILDYECKLLDGTIIHRSGNSLDTIYLDQTINGLQLALPLMSIGDEMQLWLPSRLAYGKEGSGNIPPNSILEFHIKLEEIHPYF